MLMVSNPTFFISRFLRTTSCTKELLFLPLYHVYGLASITYSSLIHSTHLVILSGFQPEQFLATIEKHKVSTVLRELFSEKNRVGGVMKIRFCDIFVVVVVVVIVVVIVVIVVVVIVVVMCIAIPIILRLV